jgi:hypothetical protein
LKDLKIHDGLTIKILLLDQPHLDTSKLAF